MPIEAWLTVAILFISFALLFLTRIPTVVIFVASLTATVVLGISPINEALKGFSNEGVLTVAALFMVVSGMYRTGAITIIADSVIGFPRTLGSAYLRILPPIAVGSGFLNNTPIVAMIIPVVRDLTRSTGLNASKLYIPISFASILGGTTTLIGTSTNLIVAGLVLAQLERANTSIEIRPLTMFDPLLVALPAAIVGILFMIFMGRYLLPARDTNADTTASTRTYSAEFFVNSEAKFIGKTYQSVGLLHTDYYQLQQIHRKDHAPITPDETTVAQLDDVLVYSCTTDSIPDLWRFMGLTPYHAPIREPRDRYTHLLIEVVVSPQNSFIGYRVADIPVSIFSARTTFLAVSRDGKAIDGRLEDAQLQAGDNAILEVNESFFKISRLEKEFALSRRITNQQVQRTDRAIVATLITVIMIAVAALGWMSLLTAALIATMAMIVTGCMTFEESTRSIEASTYVVLASAVGMEVAITNSGLSVEIANILTGFASGDPLLALALVMIGAVVLTNLVTNAAAAALMFPICLSMAASLDVSFMPFVIVLMIGSSYAFLSPAGYQTNMMVFNVGKYRAIDYVRIGFPLTLILMLIVVLIAPLVFPF